MPRYPYRDLGTGLGRDFRNKLNANFDDIEADLRDIQSDLDAKESRITQIENDSIERDNDLDARIDNLVLSAGDSSPEVADARYDSRTNTTYTTLKDRLDSHSNEIGILNKKISNTWVDLVEDFGADPTGSTDNKTQIDNALSYLSSIGGGVLFIPQNTTILTTGEHIIPSNVKIKGAKNSVIKLVSNTYASILTTNPSIQNFNIELEDITLDGNYTGPDDPEVQLSYHALYMRNVDNLTLRNVTIKNPVAWCANIVDCNNVNVNGYQAFSTGDQMDGLHFVDCNNVRVNDVYCDTGDDCIGVTVDNATKISNHFFTNIYGKSRIGSLIRLNQSDRSYNLAEAKTIETIHFSNIRGENCGNRGFSMASIHPTSTVIDIRVEGSFKNTSREGVRIHRTKRSHIDVEITSCGTGATLGDGTTYDSMWIDWIEDSTIIAKISDVTDGKVGLRITSGSRNRITANVDYVVGTKVNRQPCVILEKTTYCVLNGQLINGSVGVQLGVASPAAGALRNILRDIFIKDTSSYAIQEVGTSDFNEIQDNHFVSTGGVSKIGANTRVRRNHGHETEKSGTATIQNGLSAVTVNHGLYAAPSVVIVTGRSLDTSQCYVSDITPTTFKINVPSPVTADRIVNWRAEII
jgi:hypothetical protein